MREVQQRLAPRCVTHLREVEAAVAAAAEQEAVVGSAWLPFAGSSASVVPHRATSEVEVVVAVAGRWRKAIRQQAPLNCFWGKALT